MELYQSASTWSHKCLQGLILGFLCPSNNTFQQHMLCRVKSQGSASYKVPSQHFTSGRTHASWSSDQVLNAEIPKYHSTVLNNCNFSEAYFLFYVIHINVLRDGTIIQNIYSWHYSAPVLGQHVSLVLSSLVATMASLWILCLWERQWQAWNTFG
jgi:hypothetical protein